MTGRKGWGKRGRTAIIAAGVIGALAVGLTGCQSLEQALSPDPQLTGATPVTPPSPSATTRPTPPSPSSTPAPTPRSSEPALSGTLSGASSGTFPDLDDTPPELREQVIAVVELGAITMMAIDNSEGDPESNPESNTENETASTAIEDPENQDGNSTEPAADPQPSLNPTPKAQKQDADAPDRFEPNRGVTRRQYARWLATANNLVYGDRPSLKLRLAASTSEPAFRDVSATDPDFAVIQGLAEAGILPSNLSGAQQQISFKPNAPLTREELLLWKLPLDVRGALPPSNLEAVKEAWGFQDASKISTPAQRAVLADYQNGDQAVVRRVFGYTTLFQPNKPVTRAEAAAALAYFGSQDGVVSVAEVAAGAKNSGVAPGEGQVPDAGRSLKRDKP